MSKSLFRQLHAKGRIIKVDGYYIDRRIVRVYLLAIFIGVAAILLTVGLRGDIYVSCPLDAEGGKCWNPVYGTCEAPACQKEILEAGESLGEKPPESFGILTFLMFFFGLAAVILNHTQQKRNEGLYYEQNTN